MRLVYEGLLTNPSRPDVRRLSKKRFAGSFVNRNGEPQATSIGLPTYALEQVNLFTVRGAPKMMEHMLAYPFKVDLDAENIVVPIIGDFYGQEGVITKKLEEEGIVQRVADLQGNLVTVPVFVKTMRQLFMPCGGILHVLKVGDRIIIPNSSEAVRVAWDLIQPQGVEHLRKGVEATLEAAWRDNQVTGDLDEFKDKYRQIMTMKVGIHTLVTMKELQKSGDQDIKVDLPTFEYVGLPICGMGIKGPGCAHYDGHHIPFVEDGAKLPPHIKLKSMSEESGAAFVVDSRFDGAKGLLLTIPHQLWSSRPVGGDSIVNILSFERENLLLKHGAELSYLTTAVVPLLSRQQVPELCSEQIAIVVNTVLDDRRRIGDFLNEHYPLDSRKKMYSAAIVEKFMLERPTSGDTSFIEAYLDEARDRHWTDMCRRLGKNLRAVFEAGLTNPINRGLINNISLDGGLADTLDLCKARHPREFHNFLLLTLDGLSRFYEVAGFNRSNFFRSEYFRLLLKNSFGEERANAVFDRIASCVRPHDPDLRGVKRIKAIGLVTDEFMQMKGADEKSVWVMSDTEFLDMLDSDSNLLNRLGLAEKSVPAFRMALKRSTSVLAKFGDGTRKATDPHGELDYWRSRADPLQRAEAALSMRENFAQMDQDFKAKYGGPLSAQ